MLRWCEEVSVRSVQWIRNQSFRGAFWRPIRQKVQYYQIDYNHYYCIELSVDIRYGPFIILVYLQDFRLEDNEYDSDASLDFFRIRTIRFPTNSNLGKWILDVNKWLLTVCGGWNRYLRADMSSIFFAYIWKGWYPVVRFPKRQRSLYISFFKWELTISQTIRSYTVVGVNVSI